MEFDNYYASGQDMINLYQIQSKLMDKLKKLEILTNKYDYNSMKIISNGIIDVCFEKDIKYIKLLENVNILKSKIKYLEGFIKI